MPDPSTLPEVLPALIFVFGACIGSFLNVCIHRIPLGESVLYPGSRCPKCHHSIPFYLNIPVLSYIMLRGRCRICRTSIPLRYFIVEALTGGLALSLYYKFGLTPPLPFWFCFGAVLITVTFIDIDYQIIPDVISLSGILLFSSSCLILPGMTAKQTLAGILVGGGIPWAMATTYFLIRKQQGLGGGDIKLMAMIGAATGIKGALFTLFFGSIAGTVFGLASAVGVREDKWQIKLPFGPFLSAGALAYVFFGEKLLHWYLRSLP